MRLANTMVVTLRPSRACVHSDCSVYIALPSPTMQITWRSGQATAAPVATGVENPIEPPMFCSQSCGAAAAVGGKKPRPVVMDSSTTMAFSGIAIAIEAYVSAPVGLASSTKACGLASEGLAPSAEASASSAATEFSPPEVMRWTSQPSGFNRLGLFGEAENAHRWVGFTRNDVF